MFTVEFTDKVNDKNNTMLLNKAILSKSYCAYFLQLSMSLDLQLDAQHSKYTDGNIWCRLVYKLSDA